ncbi:MAG: hypothetical protein HRU70_01925 [Phycisphaeraceae bacterium]|nr:MAG: hypothetical protein HRU70_01925 [Phycisphaeraceae bacterium]
MPLQTATRRYWIPLAAQTLGAALLVWKSIPVYREFIEARIPDVPRGVLYAWAFIGMGLVHAAYWPNLRSTPPVGPLPMPVLGHLVQFASRLGLVFVGAFFSVVFLIHYHRLDLDLERRLMALLVLFAFFCYSKELDRLGLALIDPPRRPE